jgi:hypothetical protein
VGLLWTGNPDCEIETTSSVIPVPVVGGGGGEVLVEPDSASGPAEHLKDPSKKGWAVAELPPHKQTGFRWSLGNSDCELSQKINAQNGACNCSLKNLEIKSYPGSGQFWKQNPKRGLVTHLLPREGDQMGCCLMDTEQC